MDSSPSLGAGTLNLEEEESRPTLAFGLALVGGILISVQGALLLLAGAVAGSAGLLAAGSLLGGLGFLGVFFGLILLVLAVLLYRNPESHTGYGVGILVVSILSIVGGGGFILGLLLGIIGGVLALLFEPDETPLPAGPAALPAGARRCGNCRAVVPLGARVCPKCEAPLPPATA